MNYSQKQMWVTIPYRAITYNQMVKNEIEGISSFAQYIDFTGHVLVCWNQNLIHFVCQNFRSEGYFSRVLHWTPNLAWNSL